MQRTKYVLISFDHTAATSVTDIDFDVKFIELCCIKILKWKTAVSCSFSRVTIKMNIWIFCCLVETL